MGNKGIGRGNVWDVAPDGGDPMQKSNLGGQMKPGRVLAAYYTEGGQIKNESKVEYQEIVLESKQEAKDALTDQKVPRTYEKVVKEYFESLEAPAQ
jgi:allophanate hydrolase subunit 2